MIEAITLTSFEIKIIVLRFPLRKKHIITQIAVHTPVQTPMHTQSFCFDKERQRGSVTGSLLEERLLMIKDDNINSHHEGELR